MSCFVGRSILYPKSFQFLSPRFSVASFMSTLSKSSEAQVSSPESTDQRVPVSQNKSSPVTSSLFPGYHPVFISPHIRQIRVACRLKVYQTGFVGLLLPTSMALTEQGYLMPYHVGYVAG